MSDKFNDYEFEKNDETYSGYMDDAEPKGGRHMKEEEEVDSPAAPKRYERVTAYEEPEETGDDYGDDFYTDSDGFEPKEETAVFDPVKEENIYSKSDNRRKDRERERAEQEKKKKTGMIIAIIVLSSVILIGLIVFVTVALTSGGSKTDNTAPSATTATQATQKPSEKPSEKATQKPTEKPAPTQAPKTEAPKTEAPKTEAPVTPTEAPVTPTEAPVTPTEAPDVPTEAPAA